MVCDFCEEGILPMATEATRLVAIINESMAKRFWPGQDPIGKRIHEDVPTQNDLGWTEIVGVTNDIAIGGDLTKAPAYTFHRPFAAELESVPGLHAAQ